MTCPTPYTHGENQTPPIPTNHTLAFLPFPLSRCLVYDGEILNYHTLHCGPGVGGRIYTPYNYNWKPSRVWFGARSKKSPWGDYTSSGHAFIPLPGMRALPKVSITDIQPVGECMQDISIGLISDICLFC